MVSGICTVRIGLIYGTVRHPFRIMARLIEIARQSNARTLRIEAKVVNRRLKRVLIARYGLFEIGDLDVIEVPVK